MERRLAEVLMHRLALGAFWRHSPLAFQGDERRVLIHLMVFGVF